MINFIKIICKTNDEYSCHYLSSQRKRKKIYVIVVHSNVNCGIERLQINGHVDQLGFCFCTSEQDWIPLWFDLKVFSPVK